jgi:hypothetical protein
MLLLGSQLIELLLFQHLKLKHPGHHQEEKEKEEARDEEDPEFEPVDGLTLHLLFHRITTT